VISKDKLTDVNSSWTLFLDRDGVINEKLENDYVKTVEEFKFKPKVLHSIAELDNLFSRIVIVTNQQGIGKEIMSHEQLQNVHEFMLGQIESTGGRIDGIYYCPHLAYLNPACRKPNPGMAIQAKNDYPEINFKKSIMIGDSDSDILFGNQLGMITVKIDSQKDSTADYTFLSLADFLLYLNKI